MNIDTILFKDIDEPGLNTREVYETMLEAAGGDPRFNLRSFECLGACDIAPMASVNGDYVGPLTREDCRTIVADVLEGREPLKGKQLKYRPSAETLPFGEQDRPTDSDPASGPTAARDDVHEERE